MPEQFVRRLSADTLGNIWITTQGMGIAIFNPNGVAGYSCLDKSLQMCTTVTAVNENNSIEDSNISVYPNPFSSATTLEFNLSETKNVSINIVDVVGREVKNTSSKKLQPGKNKITFDLSELNTGIYFCKIKSNENYQTIKLIKQ